MADAEPRPGAFTEILIPSTTPVSTALRIYEQTSGTTPNVLFWNGAPISATSLSDLTTTGTVTALPLPMGNGNLLITLGNNAPLTIQGIAPGVDGQQLRIVSRGIGSVVLVNNSGSAPGPNRLLNFVTSGDTQLKAGQGTATYVYIQFLASWKLIDHEQGGWITRPFSAANYTASTGTWTVGSAARDAFWLKGTTLHYSFVISGTTSAPTAQVRITLPYAVTDGDFALYLINADGAAAVLVGQAQGVGSSIMTFSKLGAVGTFAAGTVTISGNLFWEVT